MKFFVITLLFFISFFTLSGCTVEKRGNSLHSFTEKMNDDYSYNLTQTGYIYEKDENSLRKYYVMNENNIMLRFYLDRENNLRDMNIVFDKISENDTKVLNFIECSIKSFTDENTYNEFNSSVNLKDKLQTVSNETVKENIGSIEFYVDTTDIGSVITVKKLPSNIK